MMASQRQLIHSIYLCGEYRLPPVARTHPIPADQHATSQATSIDEVLIRRARGRRSGSSSQCSTSVCGHASVVYDAAWDCVAADSLKGSLTVATHHSRALRNTSCPNATQVHARALIVGMIARMCLRPLSEGLLLRPRERRSSASSLVVLDRHLPERVKTIRAHALSNEELACHIHCKQTMFVQCRQRST